MKTRTTVWLVTISIGITALLSVLRLPARAGIKASQPMADTCAVVNAYFHDDPDDSKDEWRLLCGGDCPGSRDCKPRDGVSEGTQIKFCGCGPDDLPTCCSVILRNTGGGSFVPDKLGNCPACPLPFSCRLVPTDPSDPLSAHVTECTIL